jgi:hypothetical protein
MFEYYTICHTNHREMPYICFFFKKRHHGGLTKTFLRHGRKTRLSQSYKAQQTRYLNKVCNLRTLLGASHDPEPEPGVVSEVGRQSATRCF